MTVTGEGPPDATGVRTSLLQERDPFGPWRLETELKSGWPTRVWRASNRDLKRIGVLKFLLDESRESLARFRREYDLTKDGGNQWTPAAIDADFELFPPWIAFEYVHGETLRQVITDPDQGPLRDGALDDFGRQLWEARSYFYGVNMAHRDLSSNNVMLRREDRRVVIVDWGMGRQEVDDQTRTQGGLACTPGFAAPEQVLGDEPIGGLADVWGWGSVVFNAATGRYIHPVADYAGALRRREPIDWSGVPERWLPALQAALIPIEHRDPTLVAGCLPLGPEEAKLRAALLEAERVEAELADLKAELEGKNAKLAQLNQLAELEAREAEANKEVANLRESLKQEQDRHQSAAARISGGGHVGNRGSPLRAGTVLGLIAVVLASAAVLIAIRSGSGSTHCLAPQQSVSGLCVDPVLPPPSAEGTPSASGAQGYQHYQDVQYLYENHPDGPYNNAGGPYDIPIPANKALIVHGDLRPSSQLSCEMRVFRSGEVLTNLGSGQATVSEVPADEIAAGTKRAEEVERTKFGRSPCPVTKG